MKVYLGILKLNWHVQGENLAGRATGVLIISHPKIVPRDSAPFLGEKFMICKLLFIQNNPTVSPEKHWNPIENYLCKGVYTVEKLSKLV